jgi:tRNA A37 threonylcarbamoyladenosine biosynthesis protein TsaE
MLAVIAVWAQMAEKVKALPMVLLVGRKVKMQSITLLGGFLGTGKTTTLKHMHCECRRSAARSTTKVLADCQSDGRHHQDLSP